jgi:hypothetical protein
VKTTACPVPQDALLQRYVGQGASVTDCYVLSVPQPVDFDSFVSAFYTTALFRAERLILSITMRRRIPDSEIQEMLSGASSEFAVWRVEARADNQLLLCDLSGATRSWLSVKTNEGHGVDLYFGSAVVAKGDKPLSALTRWIMPLHILYSKHLLETAGKKLGM